MRDHKETQDGTPLWLQPVYTDAKAAIVQPDRRIDATQYFRDNWLPRLGAVRWALVLSLRGLCAKAPLQPDGTREVEVTREELAELLGVNKDTISRFLKSEKARGGWRVIKPVNKESEYLGLFIPRLRYSYKAGPGEDGLPRPRRTGYVLHVLMDDPLVPEDLARIPELAGELIASQLATEMGLQATFSGREDDSMKRQNPSSEGSVKRQNPSSGTSMKRQNPSSGGSVKRQNPSSEALKTENASVTLTLTKLTNYIQDELNLELGRRREIRQALKPVVVLTEEILDDHHSTAMLFKVLLALYPHHLDLFTAAVAEAVAAGELDGGVNRGAVFVNVLKELAAETGVELGLREQRTGGQRTPRSAAEARDGPFPEAEPGEGETGDGTPVVLVKAPSETDRIWRAALGELRLQMTQATFDTWVGNTRLISCQDDVFVIGAQNEFARDWLANRLLTTVKRTLVGIVGHPVEVRFVVVTQAEEDT